MTANYKMQNRSNFWLKNVKIKKGMNFAQRIEKQHTSSFEFETQEAINGPYFDPFWFN